MTDTTDSLIKAPKSPTLGQSNNIKNNLKIAFSRNNGYKTIHSRSNEDLCNQNSEYEPTKESVFEMSRESSPTSDKWFKTWPERYERIKSAESSPEHKRHDQNKVCDIYKFEINSFSNKLTLNEALKNISLAYSPVTKQLHLIQNETLKQSAEVEETSDCKGKGHRRTEAGSFSSTISTISEPSTSGSLLDTEDRCLTPFEDCDTKPRKKSLTNFFTKNVFSWKTGNNSNSTNLVWKLFSKNSDDAGSPLHKVASSSALIQLKRPSSLPAKSQEEEQRHADEYSAIVAAARRKEAKDSAAKQRQQKLQLQQEEQQAIATKHFLQHVIPKWGQMEKSKKTQDLWWQGLPSSVRGRVWRLAIGNELNVTPQLFEICEERARARLDATTDRDASIDAIELDIARTFPHLGIFQRGGPYSDALRSLLAAYVCFRPDVGYVQGMSYIAAILILNMDACDAFVCFANLLNRPLHLSAFTLNQPRMQAYYDAYDRVLAGNLPRLHAHFEKSGLTPDLYLLDWIYTVFAKAMPLDVACRVWDVFLRDGYEFIFRTALGILHLYQPTLLTMDFLHGAQFLTRLPDEMSAEQLFKSVQFVSTTVGKLTFGQSVERCSLETANLYRKTDHKSSSRC